MKNAKFWIAVLVAGIVGNLLDLYIQGSLMTHAFYSKIESMRNDASPKWYIIGDFVAVFVFAWVLKRVASAFASGAKGGAVAGLYLGIIVEFPTWHFIQIMFKGIPYNLAWINTIYGVVWYVIIGAIGGALMLNKSETAA